MAIEKCTSCKPTGRPHNAKKLSFDKLLRTCNDHVQVDFFFIQEIGGDPILHARDKATGYSETTLLPSKVCTSLLMPFGGCGLILTDCLELFPQIWSSIIQPLSDLLNYVELSFNQGRLDVSTKSVLWSQHIISYDYLSRDS